MTRRKTAGRFLMIPDNPFIHQKTTIMKKYMFFCALLTALSSFANTGDTFSNGGVTYQVMATSEGGGEVAVHSLDPSASLTDALIPSAVSDGGVLYDVTSVSPEAFRGSALRTVVLPEGVTAIERAAFQNCSLLTEVTLSSSDTEEGQQLLRDMGINENLMGVGALSIGYEAEGGSRSPKPRKPDYYKIVK